MLLRRIVEDASQFIFVADGTRGLHALLKVVCGPERSEREGHGVCCRGAS